MSFSAGDGGAGKDDIRIAVPSRNANDGAPHWLLPKAPTSAITPGYSLTASVLGRGTTANVHDLYEMGTQLGEGQFGTVVKCQEKVTGRRYACKSIPRSVLITEEDVEDVRNEVNILYHLKGKSNIVNIRGTYEDREKVHIVMELCEGGELFDDINRRCASGHVPYSERDAARMAREIVQALHSCHSSGVIHRDLKPENFLLTTSDTNAQLKAADFGMATFFTPGQKFQRVCGSCMYMAPEMVVLWEEIGQLTYGPAIDIWAIGVIIFILLCGSHPFKPRKTNSEREFRRMILKSNPDFEGRAWESISKEAKDLLKRVLVKEPSQRLTIQEILEHPWIVSAPERTVDESVILRFRNFLQSLQLKKIKTAAVKMISTSMDGDDIRKLRSKIASEDNGDGTIKLMRLVDLLYLFRATTIAKEIKDCMTEVSVSQESEVEYEDLMDAAVQLQQIEQQENLFKAFAVFDEDLSGFINVKELKDICDQFRVDQPLVQEMMKEITRDPMGRVDYNEFVAIMRREAGGVSRKTVLRRLDESTSFRLLDSNRSF